LEEVAMVVLRDVLSRFRAVGAPGAPAAVGVPGHRRRDAEAELQPVFDALAEVEASCAAVRAESSAQQQRWISEAGERAVACVAAARSSAPGVRAAAMAAYRRQAETDLARIESAVGRQAEEFAARAEDRIPQLIPDVVRRVRSDIAALDASVRAASSGT
jgi:hypothetical protein